MLKVAMLLPGVQLWPDADLAKMRPSSLKRNDRAGAGKLAIGCGLIWACGPRC